MTSVPKAALIAIFLGLVIRVVFVGVHQRPLISDERDYHRLALNLIEQGVYGVGDTPTAYRPIGYPGIVAVCYALLSSSPTIVKVLQAILDSITALLLVLLLRNASNRVKVIGAALWSFYIPAVLFSNFLLSETIFTTLLVATAFAFRRVSPTQPHHFLLLGALVGVLVLIKPGMVLFVFMFAATIAFAQMPLVRYSFLALGVLLVVLPWVFRNAAELGKPTLGTNGGINLLIGNNPNATGGYAITYSPDILQSASSEVEADELAYRAALQYIASEPDRFIMNGFKKLAHLVSSQGGILVWSFHPNPEDTSVRYAAKYASLPLVLTLVVNILYATLLFAGLAGFLASDRDRLWWFVATLIGCWIILHATFFGGSRFLFPLMPFFALYAAHAIAEPKALFSRMSKLSFLIFSAVSLFCIATWVVEFYVVYFS